MDKNHEVLQRHEIDWEYMLENEIDIRQLLQSRGDYINDPVLRSLPNSSWSLQGRMACKKYFLTHQNGWLKREPCRVINEFIAHKPKSKTSHFSAGTIFWMKQETIDAFFKRNPLKVQEMINVLEKTQVSS
jgi:hypothetical protein